MFTVTPISYAKIETSMNARFVVAMATYAILAILGALTLTGKIRMALWIFLGGLAAKTAIAVASRKGEP